MPPLLKVIEGDGEFPLFTDGLQLYVKPGTGMKPLMGTLVPGQPVDGIENVGVAGTGLTVTVTLSEKVQEP